VCKNVSCSVQRSRQVDSYPLLHAAPMQCRSITSRQHSRVATITPLAVMEMRALYRGTANDYYQRFNISPCRLRRDVIQQSASTGHHLLPRNDDAQRPRVYCQEMRPGPLAISKQNSKDLAVLRSETQCMAYSAACDIPMRMPAGHITYVFSVSPSVCPSVCLSGSSHTPENKGSESQKWREYPGELIF